MAKPKLEREPFTYAELIEIQACIKKLAISELFSDDTTTDLIDAADACAELAAIKQEEENASNKA